MPHQLNQDPKWLAPLRRKMHAAWLAQLTNEELAFYPDFIMQRYFLDDSGRPNRSDATLMRVEMFQFDHNNTWYLCALGNTVSDVAGLQIYTVRGPLSAIVCLGWDEAAVTNAASVCLQLEVEEQAAAAAAAEGRNADRRKVRNRYLSSQHGMGLHTPGGYANQGLGVTTDTLSLQTLSRNSEDFQQTDPEGLQSFRLDPDIRHLGGPAVQEWQGAAAGLRTTDPGAAHGGGLAEQHGLGRHPQAELIDHGLRDGTAALDAQDPLHYSGDPQRTGRMEFGEP